MDKEKLRDIICKHFSTEYSCTRDWSAWGLGSV